MGFVRIFASVVLFATLSSAQASLIDSDLYGNGDRLITLDSATNLEWLDVTYTVGLTRQSVLAEMTAGGRFDGFRWATRREVEALLLNAGIPLSFGDPNNNYFGGAVAHVAPFNTLFGHLGSFICGYSYGVPDPESCSRIHGYTSTYELDGYFSPVVGISRNLNNERVGYIMATRLWENQWGDDVGHYLVRESVSPVPAPPTFILMLTGLGLLGLTKRFGKEA